MSSVYVQEWVSENFENSIFAEDKHKSADPFGVDAFMFVALKKFLLPRIRQVDF